MSLNNQRRLLIRGSHRKRTQNQSETNKKQFVTQEAIQYYSERKLNDEA